MADAAAAPVVPPAPPAPAPKLDAARAHEQRKSDAMARFIAGAQKANPALAQAANGDKETPAAPPAVIVPEPPKPPPAEAPKPETTPAEPTPLDKLMEQARMLGRGRAPAALTPPKPKAEEVAPPVVVAPPPKIEMPRSLLARLEQEFGADAHTIFRHLTSEYEATLQGKEAPEFRAPPNPALREVKTLEEKLAAAEKRIEEQNKRLDERFTSLDQEREQAVRSQMLQNAAHTLSTGALPGQTPTKPGAERWPYITKSDPREMSERLVELCNLAAQFPETRNLTVEEIADKLETTIKSSAERYRELMQPSASPKPSAADRTQTAAPRTIVPTELTPGNGAARTARASDEQRRSRAYEKVKQGA
jgi:hypothetical protein